MMQALPRKEHEAGWTDDRIELLKKLWAEGGSCSEIAQQLGGGVSRSAIIGKVHRLKLVGRPGPANVRRANPPSVQAKASRESNGGLGRVIGRARAKGATSISEVLTKGMQGGERKVAAAPTTKDEDIVPIALMELTAHSCRWPFGDPDEPGFGFCGHPIVDGKRIGEGDSYCERHKRRACNAQ